MIHRLVEKVAEEILPETQCGFRPLLSITDMIFVSRMTLKTFWEQGRNLYIGIVDLSKAITSVERELLCRVLHRAGCPDKFVKIEKQFLEGICARVRVGGLESDKFGVSKGVKQGYLLAPVLFNVCICPLCNATNTNKCEGGM